MRGPVRPKDACAVCRRSVSNGSHLQAKHYGRDGGPEAIRTGRRRWVDGVEGGRVFSGTPAAGIAAAQTTWTDMATIFEKIVAGEIPATIVHQDDRVTAF